MPGALIIGATGLVGRELLGVLLAHSSYERIHVLLRRAARDLPRSERLCPQVIDFERLPAALPSAVDVYCCVGTTIAVAGSEAAFRNVDFDLVVSVARAARAAGAERLAVVSALGADKRSRVYYNRVKGEMEAAVATLGYRVVVIARPSLLAGDRGALGQPVRPGERIALRASAVFGALIPARYRPIAARTVARALRTALAEATDGLRIVESAELRRLGS